MSIHGRLFHARGSIVSNHGNSTFLLSRYLHCSTSFDGTINVLCDAERPIDLLIGESDEYYGSTTLVNTYNQISSLYKQKGLDEDTFSRLITFDIKDSNYFFLKGVNNQHGGGGYFLQR